MGTFDLFIVFARVFNVGIVRNCSLVVLLKEIKEVSDVGKGFFPVSCIFLFQSYENSIIGRLWVTGEDPFERDFSIGHEIEVYEV